MRRHQRHDDPLAPRRGRRVARGLTLVEVMISVSLGVVVLVAATVMLLAASRMRRNQQLLSDANQEARTALRHVARSITSAGAGGSTFVFQDLNKVAQFQTSVISFKNGAGLVAPFPVQAAVPLKDVAGNLVSTAITGPTGTMRQQPDELIVLRYASDRRTELLGDPTITPLLMAPDARTTATKGVTEKIFTGSESALITNFTRAILMPIKVANININAGTKMLEVPVDVTDVSLLPKLQDPFVTIQAGATVFPVKIIRYRLAYVPKNGKLPERTDLIMETLVPKTVMQDPPSVVSGETVVLARDVEDFQIQWGYDANGDGIADNGYVDSGPTTKGMNAALTFARINISVRTSTTLLDEKGQPVANDKTDKSPFELGLDTAMGGTPLDVTTSNTTNGYRRRILSTVVALKNVAATRI